MGDVIVLGGGQAIEVGEPNANLVSLLKSLLERAEAGDLQGIACGFMHRDGSCSWETITTAATYGLVGATQTAAQAIVACIIQEDFLDG